MESVFHKNKKIRILFFAQFINEKAYYFGGFSISATPKTIASEFMSAMLFGPAIQ